MSSAGRKSTRRKRLSEEPKGEGRSQSDAERQAFRKCSPRRCRKCGQSCVAWPCRLCHSRSLLERSGLVYSHSASEDDFGLSAEESCRLAEVIETRASRGVESRVVGRTLRCQRCNNRKNSGEFHVDPKRLSGRKGVCKECRRSLERIRSH